MRVLGAPNPYRREPAAEKPVAVDVRALRGHLGMSQPDFASRFGFTLAEVRGWERGASPHAEALARLNLIERNPQVVLMSYWTPARRRSSRSTSR